MTIVGLLNVLRSFVGTVKKLVDSGADAAAVLGRVRDALKSLEDASRNRVTSERAIADLDALADLRALQRTLEETRAASLADLKTKPPA